MKVLVKTNFNLNDKREMIATLAHAMVDARGDKRSFMNEGIPYKPNEWDDSFWTVDAGNDWKVKFYEDDNTVFEVIHRYQIHDKTRTEYSSVNEGVKSLAGLLAYRLNAKVIIE